MAVGSGFGVLCSAYVMVGLLNTIQILFLTNSLQRGLEKDPESYRKFLPQVLSMEDLIERLGWPMLLAQFTLLWPLFLKPMLTGWVYLLSCVLAGFRRALRYILLMGVDMKPALPGRRETEDERQDERQR